MEEFLYYAHLHIDAAGMVIEMTIDNWFIVTNEQQAQRSWHQPAPDVMVVV